MDVELLPDKPARTTQATLDRFSTDKHLALTKLDGWRILVKIGNDADDLEFLSRRRKPLPVCQKIRAAVEYVVREGRIPYNTVIDGEWMKNRAGTDGFKYDGPECIYWWSPLYLGGEWVGHLPFHDRWNWIRGLDLPQDDISIRRSDQMPDNSIWLPATSTNFRSFFESHINVARTEGIVIYKRDGIIVGNRRDSVKSRDILKCKWRDGEDGRTQVV
jgi:hypothetical protein